MTELEEGDRVRFTDAHHAKNSSLKGHEGDEVVVRGVDRGWKGTVLVEFTEGSSKKVGDRWDVAPERLTKIESGGENHS